MANSFRANQIQTNKIISSGSTGTNAKILIYDIASDAFGTGGIGQDTFLFISGSSDSLGSSTAGVSVFGGDVKVSGSINSQNIISASSVTFGQLQTDSSSGGVITFDFATDIKLKATLAENIAAVTMSNPPGSTNIVMEIVQGSTIYTIADTAWPSNVKWANGGTPPTITSASNAIDLITGFFNGTDFLMAPIQNFS